jgi:hypothetical protein
MKKTEKPFDAVQNMRRIRDRLSRKFQDMTYEQEKEYLRRKLRGHKVVSRKTAP